MKKKPLALLLALVLCLGMTMLSSGAQGLVEQASGLGLLVYSDIEDWSKKLTRLQTAELLVALNRRPLECQEEEFPFSDCEHLTPQQRAVVYTAANQGIMTGSERGVFDPDGSLTRAQMATIIYRTLYSYLPKLEPESSSPFADVLGGTWYDGPVTVLYEHHIIAMPPSGKFLPNERITGVDAIDWLVTASEYLQENAPGYQNSGLLFSSNVVLRTGENATLRTVLLPTQSAENYVFTTSDESIVQIIDSQDGTVTLKGVAPGSAVITVTNGGYSAQCTVDVPGLPTSISILPIYYIYGGGWMEIVPGREPSYSSVPDYTITSSDENIIKVKTEGKKVMVYGVNPGTAVIRVAASEGVFAESSITVRRVLDHEPSPVPGKDELRLSRNAVIVQVGGTNRVTANITGYEGKHLYAISTDTDLVTTSIENKTVIVNGVAQGTAWVYVVMADTQTITMDQAKSNPSMMPLRVVSTKGSGGIDGGGGGNGGIASKPSGGVGGGGGGAATQPTPAAAKPASEKFTDVAKDSWYEQGVTFVTDKGLFNGVAEGVFAPDTNMTRAMLMTVLARLDGQDTSGGEIWYAKGMDWAVANGVSDGTAPDGSVTREQLVTMLYRYAKATAGAGDLTAFMDGDSVSGWAVEAMAWAVKQGIVTGKDGGHLDPQGTATRAEVATIIQRFVTIKK